MVDLKLVHELREMGVGWQEIIDTVPHATDNTRKLYSGWLLGKEESNETDIIRNAKQLQTIRLARKELGIERSINNEQIRDITLNKTFTNQVVQAIKDLKPNFTFKALPKSIGKREHIFTLADFHYDGDETYLNVLERAYDKIVEVIEEKSLKSVYLLELGDIIEGATLRTSQLMAVKSGMVNQVIAVANAYAHMLSELSKLVHITFISVDSSNHTQLRNLGTQQNQLVEEDLMLVFNGFIRRVLPQLEMITGEDILIDINGFSTFIAHGHLVKSKEKYLETLQADRNVLIDYGFFAHYHHQRTIDLHSAGDYDKKVFYVPSLQTKHSGYEKDKNLSSKAGVGYYVFEETIGHVETRKLMI